MEFDYNFTLLLLIFMRMSGCILFNPILGRKNVPMVFKIGLTLVLTIFTYPFVPQQALAVSSFLVLVICSVKEIVVGYCIGFLIELFQSVIIMGSEQMDTQIGISMSRIYDPQSNVSMPLTASMLNAMFMLIFFVTNSHITLIKIFVKFGMAVPYGDKLISSDVFQYLSAALQQMLIYSAKLLLPVVAVEMICQVGIGLVMRAIPQIDIFTIEVQLKIIIGFAAILLFVPAFSGFLETLISQMFSGISQIYSMLV